jgi:hypothetical protein
MAGFFLQRMTDLAARKRLDRLGSRGRWRLVRHPELGYEPMVCVSSWPVKRLAFADILSENDA